MFGGDGGDRGGGGGRWRGGGWNGPELITSRPTAMYIKVVFASVRSGKTRRRTRKQAGV